MFFSVVRLFSKTVPQFIWDGCTKSQDLKVCMSVALPNEKILNSYLEFGSIKPIPSKDMKKGKKIPKTLGGTTPQ